MEKLLQENDIRREVLKEEDKQERQEQINLMNAYARLIDEQEKERERTVQDREKKMREFQTKSEQVIYQEGQEKLKVMDNRREKYERRHELKLQQEEELKK